MLTLADAKCAKHHHPRPVTIIHEPSSPEVKESEPAVHPVAALMPHLVAYVVSNVSGVIDGGDKSFDSNTSAVSTNHISVPSIPVILSIPIIAALSGQTSTIATPFHVPHLYWDCVVNGEIKDFPLKVHALIDDGSHAVLIREDIVT